jgi:hypothetical protein
MDPCKKVLEFGVDARSILGDAALLDLHELLLEVVEVVLELLHNVNNYRSQVKHLVVPVVALHSAHLAHVGVATVFAQLR